tara:strand:+ start:7209 stop:7826 length:618 start_codon:yes stop_codon:yes gene_type:complete
MSIMFGLADIIEAGNEKAVVIIPARGGSKRLPRKNIYPIWGKPMLWWAISAAKESKYVGEIWVTTEDAEIKEVALNCGAKVHDRDKTLAQDHIYKMDAIRDCYEQIPGKNGREIVISLQANSPEITSEILDAAIETFLKHNRNELISVGPDLMQNAAFRIMRGDYALQRDLSTKCGVYVCDLQDVHTIEDVRSIEEKDENNRRSV